MQYFFGMFLAYFYNKEAVKIMKTIILRNIIRGRELTKDDRLFKGTKKGKDGKGKDKSPFGGG